MTRGLQLGTPAEDAATLHCLLTTWPAAWESPWVRVSNSDGHWIWSEDLARHAEALAAQGMELVDLPDGVEQRADALAGALPLRPALERAPDEALFLVPIAEGHATLTRLLRLDRADVEVADWLDGDQRVLAIVVPDPPLYLLMRAREAHEGVEAFARIGDSRLYVEWGSTHPLADRLALQIEAPVLIGADGRWRHAVWPADWQPLSARVDARLDAPRVDLRPADGHPPRFAVHLRLEEARPIVGTLWLLSAEAFAELAPIVETSSPEALGKVSVSRLSDGAAVRYMLRARGDDVVAGRVGDLIGDVGFAHVPGAERIFVPAGQRIAPPMRLDALRAVLTPPEDGVVVIEATPDGPRIQRISGASATPLSRWVDYVTLDNRAVLDEILEESVFALPQLTIDRPTARVERRAPPPPRARRARRKRTRATVEADVEVVDQTVDPDLRARQREVAEIQGEIVAGGCTNAALLGRMGELQVALGASSDAAWCFEAAAFHSDAAGRQRWLTPLLALRRVQMGVTPDAFDAAVIDAVTVDSPSPAQVGLLGVDSCVRLMQGTPLLEGLRPALQARFAEPTTPATRRLAWLTLFELAASTDDRLGATRAKETVFGTLNTTGLRDLFDAPGFVRLALALSEDDAGTQTDAQSVQSASLEAVWSQFTPAHGEFEVQALLYKAIFAVGFARVGASAMARRLADAVTEELPVHDPPSAALARLYLARLASIGAEDDEGWQAAALSVAAGLWDRKHHRALGFARARSLWLAARVERPVPKLRRQIAEPLEQLDEPSRAPGVLSQIGRLPRAYDVEVATAVQRCIQAALGSGRDALIAETLGRAEQVSGSIRIPLHQVQALGSMLTAQALIEDERGVDASLRAMARHIRDIDQFAVIRPSVEAALAALRRVEAGEQARALFDELAHAAERGQRDAARLGGFVADGYRLIGETERAKAALHVATDALFAPDIEHATRFEAASTLLDLLRTWPSEIREQTARRLLGGIDRFRDGFTTRRFFELLKVMCVERVVDTLADTRSHGSGRIRTWLEHEEQAIRRRILTDWRQL